MDPKHSWDIVRLLEKINSYGTTVLLTTHNVEIVNKLKRRVITIDHGQIVGDQAKGSYRQGKADGPMAKNKTNTKALAQSKRHRRRMLTFWRMMRYGVANFSRNAWLTVAATAVMTITLLIIFTTVVASQAMVDTVREMQKNIDMSIPVKCDIPTRDANKLPMNLGS